MSIESRVAKFHRLKQTLNASVTHPVHLRGTLYLQMSDSSLTVSDTAVFQRQLDSYLLRSVFT